MKLAVVCLLSAACCVRANLASAPDYRFDSVISRPVLDNYLARSITMEGLLNGRGDLDDNTRMLKSIGAKFVGRALCLWGAEADFLHNVQRAKEEAPRVLASDRDMVLEACVFETVSPRVSQIAIPPWVFTAFGQPVENRNFRYEDMIYPEGQRRAMGRNAQVPDESRVETQLWFFYQAASYIDCGCEAIHFGQVEIMNKNDRDNLCWARLLALVRAYGAAHARRHIVLCNGHVPTGGLMHDAKPLLDFNEFPLRVMEMPDRPQEAALKMGFSDGIYGRSKGGLTVNGWTCDHLPYLVELDNYGVSRHPGQPNANGQFNWVWGYDEITWFAHQSAAYRSNWLQYAWSWVRRSDTNGYLEMPGSRTATSADLHWYFANRPSPAVSGGLGDEDAIRGIWATMSDEAATDERAAPFAAVNDVAWHSLGTNENNSMPLGNGDLALNIWTEQNGDIVLLLAKSDAWSENGQLLKLGRVRIKLTPSPFDGSTPFSQVLSLQSADVRLQAGSATCRVWADANQPVVRVEIQADHPVRLEATSELWRTNSHHLSQRAVQQDGFFEWGNDPDGLTFDPDTVVPARDDQVAWCHFNSRSIYPLVFEKEHLESLLPKYPDPLLHRCFGVGMSGAGLVGRDNRTLISGAAATTFRVNLYALTAQTESPQAWREALTREIKAVDAVNADEARQAHEKWWAQFWNRSWLHLSGTPEADKVSQGYIMQRYMTACAGRGAQPIKFNGSLFTVGHDLAENTSSTEGNCDPDYRTWGACYWNQNTRLLYWPLIASGDFDLLLPWFNMYVQDISLARDRTRAYFHHDGGAFIETIYFWGLPNVNDFGWDNPGPELQSPWMRHHIQGGLEVLAQMLDYSDYTQDTNFVRTSMLPLADAVITYYDQHWKRGADGKLRFAPAQSIETYQTTAVNPTPDIAGLMSTLPRLLALPPTLAGEKDRSLWSRVLRDLPPIPSGKTAKGKLPPKGHGDPDGAPVILPAEQYDETRNAENPELYAVYPYHIYGVGKPDLGLARDTFKARLFHMAHCWGQDGLDSALLGLTDSARKAVVEELTFFGSQQFPWFWKKSDWIPDMDDGGAGIATLQLMLMQCDGRRILLLPAWPREWKADFRLHAPYRTTVEGHVENGKVSGLIVTPPDRFADVEMMSGLQESTR